ncbi:MAG: hypothetical protein JXM69_07080 [Anaerolineae bacterium]|nr:hypothetical protein [Anaerolineae bacterium]
MINFAEVEKSVGELKKQLARNEIDEETLEKHLVEMIDLAEDGYYWMFGHESGRWYRHDGKQWVPDHPGEMFVPLTEIDEAEEKLDAKWQSVNWRWFVFSLAVIGVIGIIVYFSAL